MESTMIPSASGNPDGEPQDSWTLEQIIHWSIDQYRQKIYNDCEATKVVLQKRLDEGVAEMLELHKREIGKGKENAQVTNSTARPPTQPKQIQQTQSLKSRDQTVIVVRVTCGKHEGSVYKLKPTPRTGCYVGRAKGKKFTSNGIALFNDGEVSSTHGKFTKKDGHFYFSDVGSTNGTTFNGDDLEVKVPLLLEENMVLCVGDSKLEISSFE